MRVDIDFRHQPQREPTTGVSKSIYVRMRTGKTGDVDGPNRLAAVKPPVMPPCRLETIVVGPAIESFLDGS
jgi:hypothetical protein